MQIRVTPPKCGQVTRASAVAGSCHAEVRVGGRGAEDKSWVDCDRATVKRRYDRLAKFIPLFDRLLFLPPGLAYYICRAVKPSTAPAAAEVSDDEAAIEPVYRIAAE